KRLIGKMPSIAAMSYRHSLGFPYVYPDNDMTYSENFMNMLWKMVEPKYVANPVLARVLDILFILHADHEAELQYKHDALGGERTHRSVSDYRRSRSGSGRSFTRG